MVCGRKTQPQGGLGVANRRLGGLGVAKPKVRAGLGSIWGRSGKVWGRFWKDFKVEKKLIIPEKIRFGKVVKAILPWKFERNHC